MSSELSKSASSVAKSSVKSVKKSAVKVSTRLQDNPFLHESERALLVSTDAGTEWDNCESRLYIDKTGNLNKRMESDILGNEAQEAINLNTEKPFYTYPNPESSRQTPSKSQYTHSPLNQTKSHRNIAEMSLLHNELGSIAVHRRRSIPKMPTVQKQNTSMASFTPVSIDSMAEASIHYVPSLLRMNSGDLTPLQVHTSSFSPSQDSSNQCCANPQPVIQFHVEPSRTARISTTTSHSQHQSRISTSARVTAAAATAPVPLLTSFADFTAVNYNLLQHAIAQPEITPKELVSRIFMSRENCIAIMRNVQVGIDAWGGGNKVRDLSVSSVHNVKKKQGIKKLTSKISHAFDNHFSDGAENWPNENNALDSSKVNMLPLPPSTIAADDLIGLALHYHETGNYSASVFHLQKCVTQEENLLALYLLALARRHGSGIEKNQAKAFLELLESAEKFLLVILAIHTQFNAFGREHSMISLSNSRGSIALSASSGITSDPIKLRKNRLQFSNNHGDSVSSLSRMFKIGQSLGALSAFSNLSKVNSNVFLHDSALNDVLSVLPLPLFEIAVSFHQGWGIPKSIPAALYFYRVASILGDPDAQCELGYLYLKMHQKMEAAKWLRLALNSGKNIPGVSWVLKKKWGGD
ncbi:hypothetical protein HK100_012532 [Physocladia obscura]|uniref:Uncharacterized protein n=1 Tax=Physocladia obscura TaxID=109957 RepID=A0AAD5T932_9FUNG|nr:hypothetical protein HK100_012532 [Physocladia obscura]